MTSLHRPTLAIILAAATLTGCKTTEPALRPDPAPPTVAGSQTAPATTHPVTPAMRPARAQTQVPSVLFRLAQTEPAQGLSEVKLSDGSLWIQPQAVLSRADLSGVEPLQTQQGQALVRFHFNPIGARKLAEISRRFEGKLLVLTINNQLAAAPRLGEPLTDGVMVIPVTSPQQAVAIAQTIAGTSPTPEAPAK